MGDDFRDRFFTPFVMPVTIIGVMLLVGFSLSRILLTVSELGASFVALLAAGYIMLTAFWVEARKRIPARSLGIALAIGLIGLVGAGAAASAAGMRDLEEHSASEEGGGEGGESGGEGGGTATNEPVFVAIDIEYESAPAELPTGDVDLTFENNGSIEHNVVIEELGDELILEAAGGETDEATVSFEAGDYTYYCSIPGHRATMEGTLTVSDDVEAASGAGGGGGEEQPSEPGADTSESGASEGASEG
jgi:plastocyanin